MARFPGWAAPMCRASLRNRLDCRLPLSKDAAVHHESSVTMGYIVGTFRRAALAGCCLLGHLSSARAQTPARSTVIIPLKKEKTPAAKVITVHDTVTMVRVDTVRIIQTVVRTDTIFKVDTLRDTCRAALPIPIPIPIPIDHHSESPPSSVSPTPTASVAPEPATFVLVGSGLTAVFGYARFKKRK